MLLSFTEPELLMEMTDEEILEEATEKDKESARRLKALMLAAYKEE